MNFCDPNEQYKPTLDEFNEDVSSVIQRFEDTVLSVSNLTPDPFFDAFTRPMINKNFEEKTCGDGPSLEAIFNDDRYLLGIFCSFKITQNGKVSRSY